MSRRQKIILFIVLIFGTIIFTIPLIRSGINYSYGIGFWGPNGHDAIWHLSLINQLKLHTPPNNPVFSGEVLTNYHWGFDYFVALISRITHLSSSLLYFQLLPILFSFLIGILSFELAFLITKNYKTSIFFVLLNYFAGSFGWVYTLFTTHQLAGESLFWSMQSSSTLLNPPYALSLIVLLIGLVLWYKNQNSKSIKVAVFIGLIFGLLSGIKIYAGILIGIALSFYWLVNAIHTKKIFGYNFTVCLSTGIISLFILSLLGILKSNQLLEFKPFWFTNTMIESVDKFYWPNLASYKYNQTNLVISLILNFSLVGIFLIGNLGTRILAISALFRKSFTHFDKLVIFILIFSLLIPLLFTQKGTAWNTIQFFYYFLFFANFYFAHFLSNLWNKNIILAAILIAISFITSIGTLKDYFGNPPPSSLPKSEIEALNFLKKQKDGFVLTYPYNKYLKDKMVTPIPLYAYETTAYVSAFSHKQTFLEDEMNLDITGFEWQQRRQDEEKFFSSSDKFFAGGFLSNNNIKYIYLVGNQSFLLSPFDLQIDEIFNNGQTRIYQTRR